MCSWQESACYQNILSTSQECYDYIVLPSLSPELDGGMWVSNPF